MQDLLENREQLFHVLDADLQRERRLLIEQRKLQDTVSDSQVCFLLVRYMKSFYHNVCKFMYTVSQN